VLWGLGVISTGFAVVALLFAAPEFVSLVYAKPAAQFGINVHVGEVGHGGMPLLAAVKGDGFGVLHPTARAHCNFIAQRV